MPEETIYTKLPELVIYYLTRWTHQNLISTYNEVIPHPNSMAHEFEQSPQELLNMIHSDSISPFLDLSDL